jgi:hypothetical protein
MFTSAPAMIRALTHSGLSARHARCNGVYPAAFR